MRRFSSEGSLLDLDFLPWKKFAPKNTKDHERRPVSVYTLQTENDQPDGRSVNMTPGILEPGGSPSMTRRYAQTKEHSISTENLNELSKLDKNHLSVAVISNSCRAYSDGQLAPTAQGSTESMKKDDQGPLSPRMETLQHRHQHRAKLSAAKLHLKSLFGQSPHSSHSNLTGTEQKDSVSERRSRLLFMRQWSQVGHSRTRVSRNQLEEWAKSLNDLLACQTGVSVFEAFLRSEFSEENLQFYMACEQYKHSSNNFSLRRRAKDICATYIYPGAPREVNLDSKTRDLTIQLLQAPSATSLSHAQKRIYSLLDLDCYPRFLQSSTYLSLLEEAD